MPANQRSVLPALKGLPWWGAVLVAVGATTIGALIDTDEASTLGRWFKLFYLAGCLIAALAVRQRALFTAAAQPPLVAFIVGVTALYLLNTTSESAGMKEIILKVVLPTANSFPWILLTFLLTLAVVIARWFFVRPKGQALFGKAAKRTKSTTAKKTAAAKTTGAKKSAGTAKAAAAKPAGKPGTPPAKRTARPRPEGDRAAAPRTTTARRTSGKAAPARAAADAPARPRRQLAADQPRPATRTATQQQPPAEARPAQRQRPAQPTESRPATSQKRPAPAAGAPEPRRRAKPQTIPARDPQTPRRTAGQVRDKGGIEDLTAGADER